MKKLLLIATGGTIASTKTEGGLAPGLPPEELLGRVPDARTFCQVDAVQPMNLDSTNITPSHWLELAGVVEENYHR